MAAALGIGKHAEHGGKHQKRHQHNIPHQHSGEQRGIAPARRALHIACFSRLESQRYAQRDGGDQVNPQNLHRRDGQRGADKQRHNNGERFAGVGGQRPTDYFLDIVIHGAPFAHGGHDGGKIVVGEHQVGGFFGRFAAGLAHGDAGIGALECRRIINAIARHRHGEAVRLQRFHQPQLVGGRGAGKHIGFQNAAGQPGIVYKIQIVAGEHVIGVGEADFTGNSARGGGVIAGDHFHLYAGFMALLHRRHGFCARRINQADEADELQRLRDIGAAQGGLADGGGLLGHSQHTPAFFGQLFHLLQPVVGIQRRIALRRALLCAHGQ